MTTLTIYETLELYFEMLRATRSPEQAERIANECRSAFFRIVLPYWEFERLTLGRKMTEADVQAASNYAHTVSVQRLLKVRSFLQAALDKAGVSATSRSTYGNRIEQFLCWAEQQVWWPAERLLKIQHQCRPPRRLSGRRHHSELPLTSRQGLYNEYSLTPETAPPALKAQMEEFSRFLSAPHYPGRHSKSVKASTLKAYTKAIWLMLGFFYQHKQQPVPLEQLRLEDLFPVVSEDALEEMSYKEQQKLWRQQRNYLEAWIYEYFEFIRSYNSSTSPRTKLNKIVPLQRLGQYLYRDQVERKGDYATIPLFVLVQEITNQIVQEIRKWQKTKTYVSNQERKWPDVVEGETALTTVRRLVTEPLRQECRPRRKDGALRSAFAIAISLQHYLKWAFLTDLPPRRQQEYRTTKIALSCPRERPQDIPEGGYYFPLPPQEARQKNHDGTLADNYLYRTYTYKGQFYPEGIWILELRAYKTEEIYGVYSMVIPDRAFDDGTHFYDYLEHYLCGRWIAGGYESRSYGWWDPQLKGTRGRWVTKGRAEFEPQDNEVEQNRAQSAVWRSGYLLPVPNKGTLADACSFGGSFERTSFQALGKRITPHMLRHMWATWAFQVGLTDQELRSLAYAMGHSVETLRTMYERCTPEEKLRPIFEAIDRHLFQQLEQTPDPKPAKVNSLQLLEDLRQLSPQERQQLLRLAEEA